METIEEAREQLLHQIELELCRVYEAGSEAPKKLQEFHDYVAELPINHLLFEWYLKNYGNATIEYRDGEVRVIRIDNQEPEQPHTEITIPNIYDDFISQALKNQN